MSSSKITPGHALLMAVGIGGCHAVPERYLPPEIEFLALITTNDKGELRSLSPLYERKSESVEASVADESLISRVLGWTRNDLVPEIQGVSDFSANLVEARGCASKLPPPTFYEQIPLEGPAVELDPKEAPNVGAPWLDRKCPEHSFDIQLRGPCLETCTGTVRAENACAGVLSVTACALINGQASYDARGELCIEARAPAGGCTSRTSTQGVILACPGISCEIIVEPI